MKHLPCLYRPLVIACLLVFSSFCSAAQLDYQAAADDISQRLDKAVSLYKTGNVADAKRSVQMAYFSVFEGMEGPVRINYSAKYSAKLEAKFGEIRNLIASQAPLEQVEKEVTWLKNEINSLPQKLAQGHQLIAQDNDFNATSIAPEWQKVANAVNELINAGVWSYKNDEREKALQALNKALSEYQASGLSDSLHKHGKADVDKKILDDFAKMTQQMQSDSQDVAQYKKQTKQIAYQGYLITQALNDELPGLPGKADTKPTAPQSAKTDKDKNNATKVPEKALAEREGGKTEKRHDWSKVNNQIMDAIDAAIAQYKGGDGGAAVDDVQNTYFDVFEATGYEAAIGARDSAFKAQLESYFTRIVSLMSAGSPVTEIVQVRNAQQQALERAANMLGHSPQTFWEVAVQAFLILLREGLEAMLVVAAIAAYLVKNEHKDKMWVVKQSVAVGLIASVITAYIFKMIFTDAGINREILEGVTMLLATIVLFFMSYWLLSKVEARQWQAYLRNKLGSSLTKGSIIGLWLASFLAIYREGAETVLFYFALSAGVAGGGLTGISAGIVAGVVVLLAVYFIMRYTVIQLPLKPFFMFTGMFMYVMAFIFAGKGVMELVEGKVITPTIISQVPEVQWLGVYPYVESLVPQVLLILAAIAAWIMIVLRGKRA
ncbi:MAG: iron permease [Gammaproteobacteria bacterium]|nr:MAG: iron permease [Gammaproteobacteria bacterium]